MGKVDEVDPLLCAPGRSPGAMVGVMAGLRKGPRLMTLNASCGCARHDLDVEDVSKES